jgi:hypothetical protein
MIRVCKGLSVSFNAEKWLFRLNVVLIANYLLSETNISSRCRLGTFFKSACLLLLSSEHLFLLNLGFKTKPVDTVRLGCCSFTWLKRLVYGDLNRIQSSRGLERKADCNVEWMWLQGRPSTYTIRV